MNVQYKYSMWWVEQAVTSKTFLLNYESTKSATTKTLQHYHVICPGDLPPYPHVLMYFTDRKTFCFTPKSGCGIGGIGWEAVKQGSWNGLTHKFGPCSLISIC